MRDIEKRIARAEPKMPAGRALITDQKSIQRMVDFVAGYNDVADHIRCQLSDHDRDAVVVPVRNVDLPNLRADWFVGIPGPFSDQPTSKYCRIPRGQKIGTAEELLVHRASQAYRIAGVGTGSGVTRSPDSDGAVRVRD